MSDQIKEFLRSQNLSGEYGRVLQFGHIADLGMTYEPVAPGGTYKTPTPSAALPLRVRGGDVADTATGLGARSVDIVYLDTNLRCQVETLATAGASASAATTRNVLRLLSFRVGSSGTYAAFPNFSHVGDIVLEDTNSDIWGTILSTDLLRGASQIGLYTVPAVLRKGAIVVEAYLYGFTMTAATNKSVDFAFMLRPGLLKETAPYAPVVIAAEFKGIQETAHFNLPVPIGPFPVGTDLGFIARADVAADAVGIIDIVLAVK